MAAPGPAEERLHLFRFLELFDVLVRKEESSTMGWAATTACSIHLKILRQIAKCWLWQLWQSVEDVPYKGTGTFHIEGQNTSKVSIAYCIYAGAQRR